MASLLAKRGSATTLSFGSNWVPRFVKRQEELRTRHSERYDYQHAQNEDLTTLRKWFNTVQYSIAENSILPEDIYNFDETGFAVGLISTAKAVTRVESINTTTLLFFAPVTHEFGAKKKSRLAV